MAKLTLQEKVKLFFLAKGYQVIESRTNRGIAVKHPDKQTVYFILKNGYIRRSLVGKITDSYSCNLNKESFDKFCKERGI